MRRMLLTAMMLALLSGDASAQISITSLPYTPATTTFDSYDPSSASNLASTIPAGWAASSSGTAAYKGTGTGSSNQGGYWAYGTSGSPGEFSLGALHIAATGDITYAVSFTNNSGTTIHSITLAWDYEQWRYAGNNSGWDCSGTGQLAGNTTLNAKDFAGSAAGTSGTGTITQVASFTLTGLNITNGQSFGIEWTTTDPTGSDNGISIDNFSISATYVMLPINLLSFSAQRTGSFDQLSWATPCESTAADFTIERSDGISDFNKLATLEALKDNCTGKRTYSYQAAALNAPLTLYRLAMRETSGQLSYSQTLRVSGAQLPSTLALWPQPARDRLFVEGAEHGMRWQIFNLQGQELKRGVFDGSAIGIATLPSGQYFFRCNSGNARFEKR